MARAQRKGRGRPAKAPGERLRNAVTVRLTDDDMATVERLAGEDGPTHYVRQVLLRHLARARRSR